MADPGSDYSGAQQPLFKTGTSEHRLERPSVKRLGGAATTPVFDTYWRFAAERQEIMFRRMAGQAPPWTRDPILRSHRFTNAYRAADRVSQYLIRHVIYDKPRSFREAFFRIVLFRFFNRIETWTSLERELNEISLDTFSVKTYASLLDTLAEGQRIYSAAYIMPPADRRKGVRKHLTHLELLDKMLREGLPERIAETRTMKAAFGTLSEYPMMGRFLAYQYIIDLNYTPHLAFDEMEFVVPGPGARDGIRKCFSDLGGRSEAEIIRLMADSQRENFERLGLRFRSLWGRPLQLVDCQNLFCEVDKYARISHPEIAGRSGRSRIKQRLRPDLRPATYWFPPKWGINDRISAGSG